MAAPEITVVISTTQEMEAKTTQGQFNEQFEQKLEATRALLQQLRAAGLLDGLHVNDPRFPLFYIVKGNRDRTERLMSAIDTQYPHAKYKVLSKR